MVIIRIRHHWPGTFDISEISKFAIYIIEKATKLADDIGSRQVCVIYDRGQMTNANKDPALMAMIKELSGMLSSFYAERLAKLYVLHVGWFYRMMYKMAKPMIAKKTR